MKKISIIVPVYNVEEYLERCISSIVTQAVSTSEYELIVVNDGSTDGSRHILEKFYKKHPFITIVDKENGGLSSARNEGLKYATGEYIFFVDSDDWIANNTLAFLLQWCTDYPVDILVFCSCEIDDEGRTNLLNSNLSPNDKVLNAEDYLCDYTARSSAWSSLFSRKMLEDSEIRFKDGFISEDDDFIVRTFSKAKQIVCNDKLILYYYQRADSISKEKSLKTKIISDKLIMLRELDVYINTFSGKMLEGLQRKIDFLAVDLIRLLMRKGHSADTINNALNELKEIGYYPLKAKKYGMKYELFRIVFSSPKMIKIGKFLGKYF